LITDLRKDVSCLVDAGVLVLDKKFTSDGAVVCECLSIGEVFVSIKGSIVFKRVGHVDCIGLSLRQHAQCLTVVTENLYILC